MPRNTIGETILAEDETWAEEQHNERESRRVSEAHFIKSVKQRMASANPVIDVAKRDLAKLGEQAKRALLATNDPPFLFHQGGILVELKHVRGGKPTIRTFDKRQLKNRLARVAQWHLSDKPTFPPPDVVDDVLAYLDDDLPVLRGITDVPVFRGDGSLQATPGYDRETELYYAPASGLDIPLVSAKPSAADIVVARDVLLEPLSDFPLVAPSDVAHVIAMIVESFCAQMIDGPRPLYAITKPTPGTGGTLLATVAAYPACGTLLGTMAGARDDGEWRKGITSMLRDPRPIYLLDNISRLDSAALAGLLTTRRWTDRLLRESKMVEFDVSCTLVATGNNPIFSHEIARRSVDIRLDHGVEDPACLDSRTFTIPDLHTWLKSNRARLVWAVLTLITAWCVAGRPPFNGKPLASYEAWSRVIGGILHVGGVDGFLEGRRTDHLIVDPELAEITEFFAQWKETFGEETVGVNKLISIADMLDLGTDSERERRVRLGRLLPRYANRRIDNALIIPAGKRQGAVQWQLVVVDNA